MVEAIMEKYGDLTKDGDPRFLEAMMTSNVESFIPVDRVSKYPLGAEKLFAWFVYDNFDEDELEIEWIYLDDNYSIHTFTSMTGEDFGRGSFILERPDDGWAEGSYQVIIRGRGISETIPFQIHDGALVAVPIEFVNGKIDLGGVVSVPTTATTATSTTSTVAQTSTTVTPGWYFTHWEYIISSVDETLVGAIPNGVMGTTDRILDYHRCKGEKNDFTVEHERTYDDGKFIASGSMRLIWSDPPEFVKAGDKLSFPINYQLESSWGISKISATLDMADINPGGGTSGKINFYTSDGISYLGDSYQGPFTMDKGMPEGKPGTVKAVILTLSGYGFKYYYEWRE